MANGIEAEQLDEQLKRFEALLNKWAGQWFPASRRPELQRAFQRAIKKYGRADDGEGLLQILEANPSDTLKKNVIQEVLVGETYFFRDQALWSNLENIIIPDIVNQKMLTKHMRIWCAGCSTGEEAYSLALTLHRSLTSIDSWKITIHATDISEQSLAKARLGMYGQRAIREIDEQLWKNYYYTYERDIQMKESLKRLINFQQGNLSELNYPDLKTMGTDLILCRNVLIYFDRELVRKVISQFGKCLSPNGWLLLAPTEIPLDPPPGLKIQALPYNFLALRPEAARITPFTDFSLLHNESDNISHQATSYTPTSTISGLKSSLNKPHDPFSFSVTGRHVSALLQAQNKTKNIATGSAAKLPLSNAPSNSANPSKPETPLSSASETSEPSMADIEYLSKLMQARAEADRGNLHDALSTASRCTKLNSEDARGWLILGTIQESLRLYNKALESLQRAIYLDNSLAIAHLFMARTLYRLGNDDYMPEVYYFRKLSYDLPPLHILPEGGGMTVKEARVLADKLEQLNKSGKEKKY